MSGSFDGMIEYLTKHFDYNVQTIRRNKVFSTDVPKKFPVMAGPEGMGKTSSVKTFCKAKGFMFISIEGSALTKSAMLIHINNVTESINSGSIIGATLLIENFGDVIDDVKSVLKQYRKNAIDDTLEAFDQDTPGRAFDSKKDHIIKIDTLPENLFIVGEQST